MKEEKGFFSGYKEQIDEALTDLKTKGRRYRQIPNILTLSRLTAPAVIIPLTVLGNIPLTIGAVAAYGVTDLLDGVIARGFNLKSKLGADLDALADKIFAGTLLLAASITNPALLVNVGMEMGIAGINIKEKAKGKEPASTFIGKVKTWSLFALAGAGILSSNFSPALLATLGVTTTVMQGLTIASYLKKYKEQEEKEPKNKLKENIKAIMIDEPKEKEKTREKSKTISESLPTPKTQLEQLKEMRDTLLMEQRIAQPEVVVNDNYQKVIK